MRLACAKHNNQQWRLLSDVRKVTFEGRMVLLLGRKVLQQVVDKIAKKNCLHHVTTGRNVSVVVTGLLGQNWLNNGSNEDEFRRHWPTWCASTHWVGLWPFLASQGPVQPSLSTMGLIN